MGKKAARFGRLAGITLALAAAGAAFGQQVEQDQSLPDNTGLNIPQNLQIFGTVDPNELGALRG